MIKDLYFRASMVSYPGPPQIRLNPSMDVSYISSCASRSPFLTFELAQRAQHRG